MGVRFRTIVRQTKGAESCFVNDFLKIMKVARIGSVCLLDWKTSREVNGGTNHSACYFLRPWELPKVRPSPEFVQLCVGIHFLLLFLLCILGLATATGWHRCLIGDSAEIFHRLAMHHVVSINLKLVTPANFTFGCARVKLDLFALETEVAPYHLATPALCIFTQSSGPS